MRPSPTILLLSSLLVPLARAEASPTSQDAAALLDAQRAGLGEPSALAALGILQARGKVSFEGYPGEGTFSSIHAPTGATRLETNLEGTPRALRCTNGELFWMTGTGGTEIKNGWSAAADVRLFGIGRHRDWREMYERAELVGDAEIDGRSCHEIRLVPKSPERLGIEAVRGEAAPAPDAWWLDRESHDLVRVAIYATVSGAGWQRLVLDHADWRPVAGVRFPHRSRMSFGPSDHPLVLHCVTESVETGVEFVRDPFQPDDEVFAALARVHSAGGAAGPRFERQERGELLAATVRVRCKPEEIQRQLAVIFPEVMGYLQRERVAPAGVPFVRYHATGAEVDLEAGIPVAAAIPGSGRIRPSRLPGGSVVTCMHQGPYADLPAAHAALAEWLEEEGIDSAGGPWEIYWTDPGLERDPSRWRTEIVQPVAVRTEGGTLRTAGAAATGGEGTPAPGDGSQAALPGDDDLRRMDVLVGTWKVEGGPGGPHGRISFEWFEGGHFLIQHVDLVHGERAIRCLEVIGHEKRFGAESRSPDITSRVYDNMGNTLDYTWEVGDGTVTIWGGAKGSPMVFRGRFSEDRNTLTGAWKWPGGGFELTGTRIAGTDGKPIRRSR